MAIRRLFLLYILTTTTAMAASERLNFSIVGANDYDETRALYTIDGGNIWLPSKTPPKLRNRGWIDLISCNSTGESCLAVGQEQELIAFTTHDAGRTWQPANTKFPYAGYISTTNALSCGADNKHCTL